MTKHCETILLFLGLIGLVAYGSTFYIHTSEFWSLRLAREVFNPEYFHIVLIKPFFHVFLYLGYLFPLSDAQHILGMKFIFAVFGAVQVGLFYLICRNFTNDRRFSALVTLCLLATQVYAENFFRIRTDQVSMTLFLFVIYYSLKNPRALWTRWIHFFSAVLFPLIAAKSIFFSFLILFNFIILQSHFRLQKKNFFLILFGILAALIWYINLNWDSLVYFKNTFQSFSENSSIFKFWLNFDILVLVVSVSTLFFPKYHEFIERRLKISLPIICNLCLIIILLTSQKFSFFIAGFIPLFYLNSFLFFYFLYLNNRISKMVLTLFCVFYAMTGFALNYKNKVYRSNRHEIAFINYISPILEFNKLSYLDGTGLFPRQQGGHCFVSPDDEISNTSCIQEIENGTPDIIILTQRLMAATGAKVKFELHYNEVSHNIFIQKDLKLNLNPPNWLVPALLVFGFEH